MMMERGLIIITSLLMTIFCELVTSQGSCTSPAWTSVSGKKLGASVTTTLKFDKDADTYCKPQCLSQQDCFTFDSYLVGGKPSCYFASYYTPLEDKVDSIHWEYSRSCTSSTSRSCSFLYIGEYTMSTAGSFTSVSATNGEDCLQKCVDSSTCQVASYLNNNCQHSSTEQDALNGRTLQTGWMQYLKSSCIAIPTSTTTATTTWTLPTTTPCTNGGTNQWTNTYDVRATNGFEQGYARTLEDCRQVCLSVYGCNAIVYDANAVGVKCWTFVSIQHPQLLPQKGVVHETLEKCVLPPIVCSNGGINLWTSHNDVRISSTKEQGSALTRDDCRQLCMNDIHCKAINYEEGASGVKCWTLSEAQYYISSYEAGVLYETLERCVQSRQASCTNDGIGVWRTTKDRRALNGIEQRSIMTHEDCRKLCMATPGCKTINYEDNATGVRCWTFVNRDRFNLIPDTGVLHETMETCPDIQF